MCPFFAPEKECSFFAYSSKLPSHRGALLLTVDNFSFFAYSWNFLLTALVFLLTIGAFFAYSGKVHRIRALRDYKQRSLTVSKKAPTVSKKSFHPEGKKKKRCWTVPQLGVTSTVSFSEILI